ncbi:dsRBD fold-containing protein [Nonomuraea sp. LPB2021202275-12-8]|uniref:dsRBD fold-containing protein n=1 Tax=Nonomuraea sp. LPB2021202275-12-8 TaxID=3120159 RepID=UPI00300D61B5
MDYKQWNVQIWISEDDNDAVTTATAVLFTADGKRHESVAHARRNPDDRAVPGIGDELAAGRALSELGDKLINDGALDVSELAQQR